MYIKLPIFGGYDYVYWYIGTVLEKQLTSCEKLAGFQLVKKFLAFYGTRSFITAFTSARRLSLYWARSIQRMSLHPTSWRTILILSSHLRLGLPDGILPSGFPARTLYTPLLSPIIATCPTNLILNLITRIIFGEECRWWSPSLPRPSKAQIFSSAPCSQTRMEV